MLYNGRLAISCSEFTKPQISCIDEDINNVIDILVNRSVAVTAVNEVASDCIVAAVWGLASYAGT